MNFLLTKFFFPFAAPVPTVVMKEELVDAVETSETTVVEESVPIPESKENIVIVEAVKVEPITEV